MRVPRISNTSGGYAYTALHTVAVVDLHMLPLAVVEFPGSTAAAVKSI